MPLTNYLSAITPLKPAQFWTQGLSLLTIIGIADYETGWQLSFMPFYFLPVFLVSWNGNGFAAVTIAILATAVRSAVDVTNSRPYTAEFYRYWDILLRFVTFGVVAVLIVQMRTLLDRERRVAQDLALACDQLKTSQKRILEETEARVRALEQLRHTDRLKTVGRLAAGVAHELGTPLSVVAGRAQFILAEDAIDTATRRNAAIIEEQTERICRIVEQLLNYARHHASTMVPFDLCAAVSQSLEILRPLAKRHGVSLVPSLPENPVIAPMDVAQMQQVLSNLIINSVQAMPGGGTVTVEVRQTTVQAQTAQKSPHEPGSVLPLPMTVRVFPRSIWNFCSIPSSPPRRQDREPVSDFPLPTVLSPSTAAGLTWKAGMATAAALRSICRRRVRCAREFSSLTTTKPCVN